MNKSRCVFVFPLLALVLAFFSCGDSRLESIIQYEKSIRTVINSFEERSMSDQNSIDNTALESLEYMKAITPVKGGESFQKAAVDYLNFHLKNSSEYHVKASRIFQELDKLYASVQQDSVKLSQADSLAQASKIEDDNQKLEDLNNSYYPRREELRTRLKESQKELGNKNNIEFKDIEFIYEGED